MSKVTKGVLKGIVKECLVEILQEGLVETTSAINESYSHRESRQPRKTKRSRRPMQETSQRRTGLDTISYSGKKSIDKQPVNESFNKNVKKAAERLTSDPVLSSILMDTARTTLQEQNSAGSIQHNKPKDKASRIVENSTPDELFDGSDKWAHLAFAPKITSR